MLEASMFVDVNWVQLEAFCADVLMTLERSTILFLAKLPDVVVELGEVIVNWLEFNRVMV